MSIVDRSMRETRTMMEKGFIRPIPSD
jgi:hypothetical protein